MSSGYLAPVAGVAVADRADRERLGGAPDTIRKDELIALRDQVTRGGGPSPSGIDKLIENFDRVAGRGGEMTFDQFKAFAADTGVQLQVGGGRTADAARAPGAAEALGAAPADRTAQGNRAAEGAAAGDRAAERAAERTADARKAKAREAELKKADAKQATDAIDVSLLSETELRTMVAMGNQKAVLELERRSEVRKESERSADLPRVDVYA